MAQPTYGLFYSVSISGVRHRAATTNKLQYLGTVAGMVKMATYSFNGNDINISVLLYPEAKLLLETVGNVATGQQAYFTSTSYFKNLVLDAGHFIRRTDFPSFMNNDRPFPVLRPIVYSEDQLQQLIQTRRINANRNLVRNYVHTQSVRRNARLNQNPPLNIPGNVQRIVNSNLLGSGRGQFQRLRESISRPPGGLGTPRRRTRRVSRKRRA